MKVLNKKSYELTKSFEVVREKYKDLNKSLDKAIKFQQKFENVEIKSK